MWRWSRPRAEGAPRALRAHVAAAEEGKEVNRVTGFARRGTPKKVPYVDFFLENRLEDMGIEPRNAWLGAAHCAVWRRVEACVMIQRR